jgi:serine protein kinase
MGDGRDIINLVANRQDCDQFRRKNWVGTFAEYLDIVRERPDATRTAYQRIYDMILSYGVEVTENGREKQTHYNFFDDPGNDGRDAVYGLDLPLHHLVNALKSAAAGYGIERRVLLLHGPVGSSKSTIARLLKKGLERYSAILR